MGGGGGGGGGRYWKRRQRKIQQHKATDPDRKRKEREAGFSD